jgi:hypothetical protein
MLVRMRRKKLTNAGEDEKKKTVNGNVNWYSHKENSIEISQKTKNRSAISSSYATPSIYLKKMKSAYIEDTNVYCGTIHNRQ